MKSERVRLIKFLLTFVWIHMVFFILSGCSKQEVTKSFKAGIPSFNVLADNFIQTMTDLGYEKGKNISYAIKVSGIDFDAYRKILDQFVADKVLKGMDAGSISVITSELVVESHTQAAEDLGVEIPKSLMLQATNVLHWYFLFVGFKCLVQVLVAWAGF